MTESLLRAGWRRFCRNKLAMAGLVLLLLFVALAIAAPWVTKLNPAGVDLLNVSAAPGAQHWLGTDDLGRDIFARLLFGSRISLLVGFAVAAGTVILGTFLGALAGYYGGWLDTLLMRVIDVMLSFPSLFLNILVLVMFGSNFIYLILILVCTSWTGVARLVRGSFLQLREMQYVEAARATGVSTWGIMYGHLLRNATAPIIVNATLMVGGAILSESALSYLGLGVQPPATSWGQMLNNSQEYMLTTPLLAVYPGLCIFLTVLAVNFVGDGIRDAMDPRQRVRMRRSQLSSAGGGSHSSISNDTPPCGALGDAGVARPLLEGKNLTTGFFTDKGPVVAVDDVSLAIAPGETLCVVGESGSGKSVTSLSIMRLVEYENGAILGGQILLDGQDLVLKSQDEMRRVRGGQIAMIFQEPMTALNPVFTVGDQIAEAVQLHEGKSRAQAWQRAIEMLRQVGIPEPEVRAGQYPHEFSGGMRQRAMIAMALACNPHLLIADEPTTALDVTIQAQILDLLRSLRGQFKMSILLITHDMGVAAEMADRVVVMYAGKVVEEGAVDDLFAQPHHPYTSGLLASIPSLEGARCGRLHTIAGSTPSLSNLPSGCRFHPRCPYATELCRQEEPPLVTTGNRRVACWHTDQVLAHGGPAAPGKEAHPA